MPSSPNENDVTRAAINVALSELHTSLPGTVKTFDRDTQTVSVQPMVKRAIKRLNGDLTHETLPIVQNVPVMFPRGGGCSIQWPISEGDAVLLVFSEAATAQWRATGQISEPGDLRRHDLSYAYAIPGGAPGGDELTAPTGTEMLITPTSHLRVGGPTADFVALAEKVMTEMNKIRTAHNNHTHTVTVTGSATTQSGTTAAPTNMGSLSSVASSTLKAE